MQEVTTRDTADMLEIMALVYACAEATDQRNPESFAGCYTSDGVFDRSGRVFVGHADIAKGLQERAEGLQRRHIFSNLRIVIEGEGKATGSGYCLVFDHQTGGPAGTPPIIADFSDQYAKVGNAWKIRKRVVRRAFQ